MAYVERAHELVTSSTCAVTDNVSVNVTPSTFSDVTPTPEHAANGNTWTGESNYTVKTTHSGPANLA